MNRAGQKATLIQLNVSDGGMPKLPVMFAQVTKDGITGDRQRNLKYHGGSDRAVCLFSVELYEWLRTQGVDLSYGTVGENFTTRGIDLDALVKGDQLQVGDCVIELTDIRIPCTNLNHFASDLKRIIKGHSGWVAKVIVEATVKPGDAIRLIGRR
ncbi:MAG TPA: MOSC domain-containing protein [Tepidisphaeraceae bacterium]|jgi:MOSC domain-containing protein YiiM